MYTYKILSDTSCDIPAAVLEQLDVTYVPFHVSFDTVNYLKESIRKPLCPLCRITWMPWNPF